MSENNSVNKSAGFFSKIHTFESFKFAYYRYFFFGMVGQWSAMNMQIVTNSLLAYRVSGSGAILGLVALMNALPMLILSIFGGVVSDRAQKKTLLQIGQVASSLVSLTIGIFLLNGYLSIQHPHSWVVLLFTSTFQGIVAAFVVPSRQAIIPELVPHKSLMNAVSLYTMGMNIFRLASPAIAGILIDTVGFEWVYFIMAGLFASGIIFNAFLPKSKQSANRGASPIKDIKEGLVYIKKHSTILVLLSIGFAFVLFFIPFQNLISIFADSILKCGATGLGILMSVSGAGALAASFFFASVPVRKRGWIHLASTLMIGVALLVFSFSTNWTLSLIMMIFIGIGQTGHVTTGTALIQSITENQYMGRVMSLIAMNWGLSGLGTFLAGVLSDSISVQWAVGGFAVLLICFVTIMMFIAPRIRKLE
jgi:MFS family permease